MTFLHNVKNDALSKHYSSKLLISTVIILPY